MHEVSIIAKNLMKHQKFQGSSMVQIYNQNKEIKNIMFDYLDFFKIDQSFLPQMREILSVSYHVELIDVMILSLLRYKNFSLLDAVMTYMLERQKIAILNVVVADLMSNDKVNRLKNIIIEQSDINDLLIIQKIDKTIIGGYILYLDDIKIDSSLNNKINCLKKILQ